MRRCRASSTRAARSVLPSGTKGTSSVRPRSLALQADEHLAKRSRDSARRSRMQMSRSTCCAAVPVEAPTAMPPTTTKSTPRAVSARQDARRSSGQLATARAPALISRRSSALWTLQTASRSAGVSPQRFDDLGLVDARRRGPARQAESVARRPQRAVQRRHRRVGAGTLEPRHRRLRHAQPRRQLGLCQPRVGACSANKSIGFNMHNEYIHAEVISTSVRRSCAYCGPCVRARCRSWSHRPALMTYHWPPTPSPLASAGGCRRRSGRADGPRR